MTTATITDGMPFSAYLAHPGYSSSDLRTFRAGPPSMVPWRRANRGKGTDATKIGSAAHCMLMTPQLFDTAYWRKPDGMEFRSAENKKIRDDLLARGVEILDSDDLRSITGVVLAVGRKLELPPLHQSEQTIVWRDADSGLLCKSRPDWFDVDAVYDFKCSIVAEKDFGALPYIAHAKGWLHQLANGRAALAAVGRKVNKGRLVLASPNAPHTVHLLEVRENDLDFLEMDNQDARRGIAHCERTGQWPGTPDTWQTIELPASAAFTESDLNGAEEELAE